MVVYLPDPHDPLRLAGCQCVHCGYELKGVRDYRCPECGNEVDVDQARFGPPVQMSNVSAVGWLVSFVIAALFLALGILCFEWISSGVLGCFFVGLSILGWFAPVVYDWLLE